MKRSTRQRHHWRSIQRGFMNRERNEESGVVVGHEESRRHVRHASAIYNFNSCHLACIGVSYWHAQRGSKERRRSKKQSSHEGLPYSQGHSKHR
jgi:hypothetical protein